MPTDNPMFSSLADLSGFHDPSRSEHSGPIRKPEASAHITVDVNSDAGHATDPEEREANTRTQSSDHHQANALFHDTFLNNRNPLECSGPMYTYNVPSTVHRTVFSYYQQRTSEYVTLLEAPHVTCPLLVQPSCRTTTEPLALT